MQVFVPHALKAQYGHQVTRVGASLVWSKLVCWDLFGQHLLEQRAKVSFDKQLRAGAAAAAATERRTCGQRRTSVTFGTGTHERLEQRGAHFNLALPASAIVALEQLHRCLDCAFF